MIRRLAVLDIIRGPLAAWVVIAHILFITGGNHTAVHPEYAVELFLVITGFVTAKLVIEKAEPYSVFIVRRFFRIWPVLVFCLALNLAVTRPAATLDNVVVFLSELAMLHGLIPDKLIPDASMRLLVPAWYVSVVWQFFLVAPLFVRWVLRLGWRSQIALAILWWIPVNRWINAWLPHYWRMESVIVLKLFWIYAGIMAYRYWPHWGQLKLPRWTAPLEHLGTISYSMYLVHFPIILFYRDNLPLAVLLIFVASVLVHSLIEVPGVRLGQWLLRLIG